MAIWTFEPPFPEKYSSTTSKKLFIAAEPNGDNDRPTNRDMGEWIRNVPKSGTKFYRYLASIAGAFAGINLDPREHFDPFEILGEWRFIDLVKEEAGPVVTGDFKKRVKNNLVDTLGVIIKDNPSVIVLLGGHSQNAFETIVVPALGTAQLHRIGMPHPSSRIGGYINRNTIGDPWSMLRKTPHPMMTYGHRNGWTQFKA